MVVYNLQIVIWIVIQAHSLTTPLSLLVWHFPSFWYIIMNLKNVSNFKAIDPGYLAFLTCLCYMIL